MSDDDGVGTDRAGWPSVLERLFPPVDPRGQDGQPKPSRMTSREQLVTGALGFANVAIAAAAAATIERHQALALLAGVLASAVTLAGARVGNRILAMLGLFACVVTRSADTVAFLAFALPYYAAAMWIFLRYNRQVKAQAILRRQQRAAAKGTATAAGARPSAKGTSGRAPAGKSRPTASKRYTPPKRAKKRPPPPPKPPRDRSIVD